MTMPLKIAGVLGSVLVLSSCMPDNGQLWSYPSFPEYNNNPVFDSRPYPYPHQKYRRSEVKPKSYFGNSPVSFKERDRSWVRGQNPSSYTIEVSRDPQASTVASELARVPKSDRTAEVKTTVNGKEEYTGVYGSFNNSNEAHKAMGNLPTEVKDKAAVKTWGSVQGELIE